MNRQTMQRPVMDPMFLRDVETRPSRPKRWVQVSARILRWIARQLLSHPIRFRRNRLRFQNDRSRILRSIGYRLMFAPIVLALVEAVLVFCGTHPQPASASGDPGSFGVFYDPIDFASEDGVQLTGWMVPVVDARRVLLHKERLLQQRYPAVVLAHDFGQSPSQMLPLVAPLHEDGMVVLVIGLRGVGTSNQAAQTFGLNEAGDITAAVNLLKGRPFVDPSRIAVVGIGTGGSAAMLAASKDPTLAAIVLANAPEFASDIVNRRLGPDFGGLRWMQPVTKWAFELSYHHDIEELSLNQHHALIQSPKVLRIGEATTEERLTAGPTDQIRKFCNRVLRPWERSRSMNP